MLAAAFPCDLQSERVTTALRRHDRSQTAKPANRRIGANRKTIQVTRPSAMHRLALDRRGITAVEYGIVAAFLCVGLLSIFTKFGSTLTSMFLRVNTGL